MEMTMSGVKIRVLAYEEREVSRGSLPVKVE
jgi:hypothetical protein